MSSPSSYVEWDLSADLIGLMFNWGLLGILSLQIYGYICNPTPDSGRHRAAVDILFLVELVQSVLLAVETVRAVTHVTPQINLFWLSVYLMPSTTTYAATQWFYVKRIIELSRRHIWSISIGAFSVLQLIAGVFASIFLLLIQRGVWDAAPFQLAVWVWLSLNLVASLLIVVAMSITLSRARWTCYSQSSGILTRLAAITVETGGLMATGFILAFGLQFSPHPVAPIALFILSKLSACTLLACLNNIALNGQSAYYSTNVDMLDDLGKVEFHPTVHGDAGYENAAAGLAYVQYGA
ncbi:uncharacterized protein C8Q71DRAFT_342440 [Rhodofomes roseus]|uniref:DUF6534 domain-containing protein n=1 Tax=Rhodofomes roseus TaxID=34475 RepID=A0ABQ8KS66_9APHY|nr:uncharacterized protein C8Q71DRAFT_342440 [Rhodofomes roseus]KAH9841659.1 hypothetical protein C8Q71DRAFT_342440 [Rhodofomes roseus]